MTDHNAAAQQGVSPDRYRLIPRTLIFLTRDGQVLLLKGAAHKRLWANLYNGVGGHVERGEDILASARRELAEETGLQEAQLWLCGVITVDTGGNTGIGIYVLRGELAADASPLPESQEGLRHSPENGLREDRPDGRDRSHRWARILSPAGTL